MTIRHDIAYPFSIAPGSRQAAQTAYADHVRQMVRQILLTDPGERVCLPEFGAGMRRLLFSPITAGLEASVQILVLQSLKRWLGDQITVRKVKVRTSEDAGTGGDLPEGAVAVEIEYELIETRQPDKADVRLSLIEIKGPDKADQGQPA